MFRNSFACNKEGPSWVCPSGLEMSSNGDVIKRVINELSVGYFFFPFKHQEGGGLLLSYLISPQRTGYTNWYHMPSKDKYRVLYI